MIRHAVSSFAIVSALSCLPASADAQNQAKLYKEVKGWKVHSFAQSESSSKPSCSAVMFRDHVNAMRVERFEQGYLFGINGLSRKEQGREYDMSFWFDGDKSTQMGGMANFVKDAAYPHDDWLSFFHPAAERGTLVAAIANQSTMSFSFRMPGNRTGNDIVETEFALTGSAAALLALDECYQVANSQAVTPAANTVSAQPSDCPDDGPRLPGSGICQGRGVNWLEIVGGEPPVLYDNCSWKLNEAAMPGGDYLLYLASSCGPHTTKLEFSAGARFAEVMIAKSGLSEGEPGGKILTVAAVDGNDPKGSVLRHAQSAMADQAAAAKCFVQGIGADGYLPSDAFVINDKTKEEEAKLAVDGPLDDACGPFGRYGESLAYWRVVGGYGWFFDLGQDAYQDIDPRSLTVIKAADLPK